MTGPSRIDLNALHELSSLLRAAEANRASAAQHWQIADQKAAEAGMFMQQAAALALRLRVGDYIVHGDHCLELVLRLNDQTGEMVPLLVPADHMHPRWNETHQEVAR